MSFQQPALRCKSVKHYVLTTYCTDLPPQMLCTRALTVQSQAIPRPQVPAPGRGQHGTDLVFATVDAIHAISTSHVPVARIPHILGLPTKITLQ